MELLRTAESAFDAVVGYDHAVTYAEVPAAAGSDQLLRMAYVDAGPRDAPAVLCLHGEPSWGFLYRHVAARLLETGHRVIIPDLVGFGRSDKPSEVTDHTYAAHVSWLDSLIFGALELTDLTLLCQDWGGLLGLRLVAAHPGSLRRGGRRQHRAPRRSARHATGVAAVPRLRGQDA